MSRAVVPSEPSSSTVPTLDVFTNILFSQIYLPSLRRLSVTAFGAAAREVPSKPASQVYFHQEDSVCYSTVYCT